MLLDKGGEKYSQLCSRCQAEINLILIDSDEDTKPPVSGKSNSGNELLFLGSRKRKREIASDDRNDYDGDIVEVIEKKEGGDAVLLDEYGNISDKVESHTVAPLHNTPNVLNHETKDDEDDTHGIRWKSFSEVAEILRGMIRKENLSKKRELAILAIIDNLEKKPNLKPQKIKVVMSNRPHPMPGKEIEQLLRGPEKNMSKLKVEGDADGVMEEDRHPWIASKKASEEAVSVNSSTPATTVPKMLLRVWDDKSQARIREGSEGFLSGCNYMPLHTKEQRKNAIENHANWGARQKTAFISTTTDFEDIATQLVPRLEMRQKKKGLSSITKITLINCRADGMPILPIRNELDFYKCHIPYVRKSWFATEFLFLFRITKEQIVKTWLWKDVEQWLVNNKTESFERWYQEVLVPAYDEHEENRISGSVESAHDASCSCCGH
jgi:hypothetical protein